MQGKDIKLPLYPKIDYRNNENFNLFSLFVINSVKLNYQKYFGQRKNAEKNKLNLLENQIKEYNNISQIYMEKANKYLDQISKAYKECDYEVLDFIIRSKSRCIFGISSGLAYLMNEIGLCFDPYLNLPFIPASTIKGALSSALRFFEKDIGLSYNINAVLFGKGGYEARIGGVVFSNAYPINKNSKLLVIDVISPHYQPNKYLGGTVRPEDYELKAEPVPIIYIAVDKGVDFRFLVAYNYYWAQGVEKPSHEFIRKMLNIALFLGLGAKTTSGFGVFELVKR